MRDDADNIWGDTSTKDISMMQKCCCGLRPWRRLFDQLVVLAGYVLEPKTELFAARKLRASIVIVKASLHLSGTNSHYINLIIHLRRKLRCFCSCRWARCGRRPHNCMGCVSPKLFQGSFVPNSSTKDAAHFHSAPVTTTTIEILIGMT
jgi:hypothetical protein